MNFLRTLLWVVVAVSLAIFATRNWIDVTINLWGNLQADVKLPVLLLLTFLVGFLPTFLILRGRLWALRRKLLLAERPVLAPIAPPATTIASDEDDAA
jgi:lipopolysaccharide assembly protein A